MNDDAGRKLDILIPVYNEGKNIVAVLEALRRNVRIPFRVLICYDREDDDTLPALRGYPAPFQIVPIRNQGRGVHSAICTGFRVSRSAAVLVLPADDTYNAGIIDRMFGMFEDGCDVVVASRFMPGGRMEGCPWLKAILVRTAAFTLRHFARLPTSDASNGFRLFSRRLLDQIVIESSQGFTYSLELLVKCHRLGWKIGEVPALWFERRQGKSRFRLFRWLPEYLRWYFYTFATTYLRRGPGSVARRRTGSVPSLVEERLGAAFHKNEASNVALLERGEQVLSASAVPASAVICAGLFLLALLPRLLHLAWTLDYVPTHDDRIYDYLAVRILRGETFDSGVGLGDVDPRAVGTQSQPSAYRTPGLPLVLALVYLTFGHNYLAARGVFVTLNSLVAPALFTLGRDLFGWWVGLLAALMWACWPMSIYFNYSSDTLFAEPLAIPITVFGVWMLVSGVLTRRPAWLFGAGLSFGLAVLTRGYLLVAVAVGLVTVGMLAARRCVPWRGALVMVLGVSCLLGPWLVRNYLVFDTLVFSTNVDTLWLGNNQWARGSYAGEWRRPESQQWAYILAKYPGFVELSELEKSRIYLREARDAVLRDPARTVWLMFRKTLVFFFPFYEGADGKLRFNFSFVFMIPLFALGTVVTFRSAPRDAWLLFFPILSLFVALLIAIPSDRYRAPAEPFAIMFAGVGIGWLADRIGRGRAALLVSGWLTVNLAGIVFSDVVVQTVRSVF